MIHDPRSDPHSAAIEQLEAFRLSTYAAQTFVALSSLGSATAKEVSQVSDVPRTRVYDAVDELHDRGLVDIRESSPQQFMAISVETARRTFQQDVTHRLSTLTTALDQLKPVGQQIDQHGVWTVSEPTAIVDRLLTFFSESDEEIIYLATEEYLSAALIDGLSTAADRGVTIKLGGLSTELFETIQTEIPTAERTTAALPSEVSRLLLVDGSKTLVSVPTKQTKQTRQTKHSQQTQQSETTIETSQSQPATDGQQSTTDLHTETDPVTNGQGSTENPTATERSNTETAIWGVGDTNSLVVILKSIFGLHAGAI